jgi:hypothetical protein
MPSNDIVLTAAEERQLLKACRAQWLDDVPAAFADLPREGTKLEIHSDDQFPDRFSYTETRANGGGNENHFQGCQRLPGGHYLAVSGGDWRHESSHLFVGRLVSRAGRKRWGSNIHDGAPPESDKMVARLDLHPKMWHAGGIALCGHVLAVPVECGGEQDLVRRIRVPIRIRCDPPRSRVLFIDVATPASPRVLSLHIHRRGRKATAVALTDIWGGGYVLAVLSSGKEDEHHRDKQIDFYRSVSPRLCQGFVRPATRLRIPKRLKWDDYQTINFVREKSGALYLCGMKGKILDLFEVTLPASGPPRVRPDLRFLSRREFSLDGRYAAFKAGVGVYVQEGALGLYAVPQWRRLDGRLGLTEWAV